MKLLNVMSRVKDLLLITKLYAVFEVFDEEGRPSGASRSRLSSKRPRTTNSKALNIWGHAA